MNGLLPKLRSRLAIIGLTAMSVTACSIGSGEVRTMPPDGNWRRLHTAASVAPLQTLSLVEAGRVSGDAGCNRYSGSVLIETDGSMRIGPLMSTKRACLDGGHMRAETEFLALLGDVRSYRLPSDGRLRLIDAAGATLAEFERAAAPGR